MPDHPSEELKQAIETALSEARRLDLQLLVHLLMMAKLELESHGEAMRSDEMQD